VRRIQLLSRLIRLEIVRGIDTVELNLTAVREADTKLVALLMLVRRMAHDCGVELRVVVSQPVHTLLELCHCADMACISKAQEDSTIEVDEHSELPGLYPTAPCHGAWPSGALDSHDGDDTLHELAWCRGPSDVNTRSNSIRPSPVRRLVPGGTSDPQSAQR
jgi:ABC-type transporter Mla MlaB component